MGVHRTVFLGVLVVTATILLSRIILFAEAATNVPLPTPAAERGFFHNCMEAENMEFDVSMLPKDYHQRINFTVQDCEKVDFTLFEVGEPMLWERISFKRIGILKLRLTRLPAIIKSIEIDGVNLDKFTQINFERTSKINLLSIKNSIIKSINQNVFQNPRVYDVNLYNVTFQMTANDALTFKFGENSNFRIENSVFLNAEPRNIITASNATYISVVNTTFASKLDQSSINLTASEKIIIQNVTFTELHEKSVWLSAPTVQLIHNYFNAIVTRSIALDGSACLVVVNNTFQPNVQSPIFCTNNQKTSLKFFCNSLPYGSFDSNATGCMMDTTEHLASKNDTFCELLSLNKCNKCKNCEIGNPNNGHYINSSVTASYNQQTEPTTNKMFNTGSFKHVSIVILIVKVALLKIFWH